MSLEHGDSSDPGRDRSVVARAHEVPVLPTHLLRGFCRGTGASASLRVTFHARAHATREQGGTFARFAYAAGNLWDRRGKPESRGGELPLGPSHSGGRRSEGPGPRPQPVAAAAVRFTLAVWGLKTAFPAVTVGAARCV